MRRDPLSELLGEVSRVQDEMGRLFGRYAPRGVANRLFAGPTPAVNVWEDAGHVYAEADLPGLLLEKLEVMVHEGNQLTIAGERLPGEFANAVWHRQERPTGRFSRVVTLPALVDAEKVEAKFEHGVLRLTLPKSEAARPKKITVQAG